MAEIAAQMVKAQADIVRVIGEYVRLRKTGAQNYTGLCPFHKEKTGSFSVNATRGFYYCFGCHETGDVFAFVMKLESVSVSGGGAGGCGEVRDCAAEAGVRVGGGGAGGGDPAGAAGCA